MARTDLGEIVAFVSAVDEGSFVAAGRAMGLTRSAVGKAMSRLEERLGARLLNRTTRQLSLTDVGRSFYERCTQLLADLDEAEAGAGRPGSVPRGVLRLTIPAAFGRLHVLPLLADYLSQWPELEAEVNLTDRVMDIVEEGFDLAIRIGPLTADTGLIARTVARYSGIVCASQSYLNLHAEPETPADLEAHDCLVFSSRLRRRAWRLLDEGGLWVEVAGRDRLRLDSGEAIRDAAVAGMGVAYLPSFLVDDDIRTGRLRPLLQGHGTESVTILAVYPTKRHLPAKVRCLIELMAERWRSNASQTTCLLRPA